MRRDANFGIGDAKIQVKEEKKIDKSNIILVFRYSCCPKFKKKTDINLGLPKFNFRYILFFVSFPFG